MLFRRLVTSALLVGIISGLLLSVVQWWQVIPIIASAERFEQARTPQPGAASQDQAMHVHADAAVHQHAVGGHEHATGTWEPTAGAERIGFTVLSNVLTAVGFALVMLATMAALLRHQANAGVGRRTAMKIGWRYGLFWGMAGYVVFFAAPAIGLPPEIPGAESAPLESRQLWWTLTVMLTAAGLGVTAFVKSPLRWFGLAMLVAPHLIGAPHLVTGPFAEFPANVQAEMMQLARRFVWATAIANAVFWLALGIASTWTVRRFLKDALT